MKDRIKITPADADAIDIEQVMADIANAANAERAVIAMLDDAINKTTALHERQLAPIREKIALLTLQAKQWADAHPEQFAKRKSIKFAHGKLGFRDGMPKLELLNKKWKWKGALEAVQKLLPAFIRSAPEIDKEALIAQRDEAPIQFALPRCGLKVTQDEGFFIKPKLTPIKDTARVESRTEALVA